MINKKDILIISNLRINARMPLTKMSRKINIPVSTIFDRLKINENGLIKKHTCLLNFSKLGYNVRANIAFKVEADDREGLKEYLLKHESANSVYKINNGFDFMIEGIFREIREMEDFIEDLEKRFRILDKKSFYIIEDLKREEFLSKTQIIC